MIKKIEVRIGAKDGIPKKDTAAVINGKIQRETIEIGKCSRITPIMKAVRMIQTQENMTRDRGDEMMTDHTEIMIGLDRIMSDH